MGWKEQQNGNYFQIPKLQYLVHNTETQLQHAHFKTLIQQSTNLPPTVDRYSTNSLPIFYPQLTLSMLANTVKCQPIHHSLYRLSVDRHIDQHVDQYSANMLTNILADSVNQYSIEGCTNYTRSTFSAAKRAFI